MKRTGTVMGFSSLIISSVIIYVLESTAILPVCIISAAALSAALLIPSRFRLKGYLAAISLSALLISVSLFVRETVSGNTDMFSAKSYTLRGIISEQPAADSYGNVGLIVKPVSLERDGTVYRPNFKISLESSDVALLDVRVDDIIECEVTFFPDMGQDNIISDLAENIRLSGFISDTEITVNSSEKRSVYGYAVDLRNHINSVLRSTVPGDEGILCGSVLTDDKSQLSPEIINAFRTAGISHYLTVSGLHLSFLAGFILSTLSVFVRNKKAVFAVVLLFALGMIFLVGFTPSVIRAAIMTLIPLAGKTLLRRTDSLNSLGSTVFIMLALNPYLTLSVSFLLSFSSVLGILCFSLPLTEKAEKFIRSRAIRSKMPSVINAILSRAALYLLSLILITLGASIFTAPVSILFFGYVSVYSIFANLLSSFAVTAILLLSFLLVLLSPLTAFTGIVAPLLRIAAAFVMDIAEFFSSLPYATVHLQKWYFLLFFIVTASVCALSKLRMLPKFLKPSLPVLLAAIIAAVMLSADIYNSHNSATVSFYSRYGTSASLFISSGRSVLLLAAGDGYSYEFIRSELQSHNISCLDHLILLDSDAGDSELFEKLMSDFTPETLYIPGADSVRRTITVSDCVEITLSDIDSDASYAEISVFGKNILAAGKNFDFSLVYNNNFYDIINIGSKGKNKHFLPIDENGILLTHEYYYPETHEYIPYLGSASLYSLNVAVFKSFTVSPDGIRAFSD